MKAIVYQNIKETVFNYEIYDLCFHFSSLFNKNRFVENVKTYCNIEEMKIINKYQLQIDIKKYLAIAFYKKIERRGFYISIGDEPIPEDYKLEIRLGW